MQQIDNYIHDGANWQAQCVLAYLRSQWELVKDVDIQGSEARNFLSHIWVYVSRYDNCREQGYTFSLVFIGEDVPTVHYTVFEHRNSDRLCILKNHFDIPHSNITVEDIWQNRNDKYDIDKDFPYGDIMLCCKWLIEDMKTEIINAYNGK